MKSLTFIRGAALGGALTLAHASGALAAGSGENTPLHLPTSGTRHVAASGGSSLVRTIVGLLVVVAVIYGISWILRQTKGAKNRASGRGLSQVASLPLGSGRSVALVRAGSEIVLVGVADHSVTPIRTYSETEARALGLELPEDPVFTPDAGQRPGPRLADALRRLTVRS